MDNSGGINDQLLYGALGRVSAIESQQEVSPQPVPIDAHQTPLSQRYAPGLYGSYWEAISMSGVALPSPGTDWTSAFFDPSATLVFYQMPSTSGEFVMNGDSTDARFAQVAVVCENGFACHAKLKFTSGGVSPRVQVHCNGGFDEYVASSDITLQLRGDGQTNLIKIITNFNVGDLEFRLTLWDGDTCFWLDPKTQEAAAGDAGATGSSGNPDSGTATDLGGGVPLVRAMQQVSPVDQSQVATPGASPADISTTTYGSGSGALIPQIVLTPDNVIASISAVALSTPLPTAQPIYVTQSADITDTNFTGTSPGRLYRISVDLEVTTADGAAGTITCNIKYTDSGGSRTQTVGPVDMTGTNFAQATFVAYLGIGNITHGVTHTGSYGTAQYALRLALERLI